MTQIISYMYHNYVINYDKICMLYLSHGYDTVCYNNITDYDTIHML